MNLLQQQVTHLQFGAGAVTGQTEKTLTVQFGSIQKVFLFPSAFEQFLALTDPEQDARMRQFLREQQALALAKLREAEEAERSRIAASKIAAMAAKRQTRKSAKK